MAIGAVDATLAPGAGMNGDLLTASVGMLSDEGRGSRARLISSRSGSWQYDKKQGGREERGRADAPTADDGPVVMSGERSSAVMLSSIPGGPNRLEQITNYPVEAIGVIAKDVWEDFGNSPVVGEKGSIRMSSQAPGSQPCTVRAIAEEGPTNPATVPGYAQVADELIKHSYYRQFSEYIIHA
ncbi:hypothetical protein FRC12_003054 [Ceratobasidium sp. 428]|nr:hypothetical protein FRC12_003054 [Ceratobasidium sp. 428]